MKETSSDLGALTCAIKFSSFKVTNKNFILHGNDKKISIPIEMCKFDVKQFPQNIICYIARENH